MKSLYNYLNECDAIANVPGEVVPTDAAPAVDPTHSGQETPGYLDKHAVPFVALPGNTDPVVVKKLRRKRKKYNITNRLPKI